MSETEKNVWRGEPYVVPTLEADRQQAKRLTDNGAEFHAVYLWVEENTRGSFEPLACIEGREPWPESGVSIDPRDGRMIIATLEGGHWANIGDWIIRGVRGEFYPCRPDVFARTYDPVVES